MKLWRFIVKNVLRNKRRTILTVISLALSLFIVNTLMSVLYGLDNAATGNGQELRLMVRNKVSLTHDLPESYWEKIKQVPHVKVACPRVWYQGVYKDQTMSNWFARFSTDPESELQIVTDTVDVPEDVARAWKADRRGAIAGKALFDQYGWKVGDNITIKGDIYPVDLVLTLRGAFTAKNGGDPDQFEKVLLFQRAYLEELLGRPGMTGIYWLKVDSPENMTSVSRTIDAMFENSDAETLTETEKQFQADFVSMLGNVKGLIKMLSLVVAVAILMVAANTMAMAVRERTTEVAVLKAIGFTPGLILTVIVSESLIIAVAAALVACIPAFVLFNLMGIKLPMFWTPMNLTLGSAALVGGIALTIGLISGLLPGFLAARLSVTEGLRKVA